MPVTKGTHILMKTWTTSTLSALAIVALLGVSACSDPGADVPNPGQGTGGANASQPVNDPTDAQPGEVGEIEESAPEGGAAARIGDKEETVSKVACTILNGQWTMSGGDDEGAKVAVTATEDRATVQSASVVLSDGTVASMTEGTGSASIVFDGETFTLTGNGPVLDLNNPSEDAAAEGDFVITATCQS